MFTAKTHYERLGNKVQATNAGYEWLVSQTTGHEWIIERVVPWAMTQDKIRWPSPVSSWPTVSTAIYGRHMHE